MSSCNWCKTSVYMLKILTFWLYLFFWTLKKRWQLEYMVRLREQTHICVQILHGGFWIWPQEGFSEELVRWAEWGGSLLRQESEAGKACAQVSSYNKHKTAPMIQPLVFCTIMRVNYDWIVMICYIPKLYDHVRFTNGPLRYDLYRQGRYVLKITPVGFCSWCGIWLKNTKNNKQPNGI